jgi:ribosomal protein L4
LASHAQAGTIGILDASVFDAPSTKLAKSVLDGFGKDRPVLVVANAEEENVVKSFRNLDRALVVDPSEVEVAALVWARTLVVTEGALELLQRRAS